MKKVEGQDPLRPKYGTKVKPSTQNKDGELHTKRRKIVGSGHQSKGKTSPSGK